MCKIMAHSLRINDSTLHEREQFAGMAFTLEQKLDIARQLDALGVQEMDIFFFAS